MVILPGKTEKTVQIYDSAIGEEISEFEVDEIPHVIAGNIHGDVLAYAGVDGTKIYLHKLEDGSLFKTFNRGMKSMEVNQIVFDKFCFRMAVASTGDTIHVFSLPKDLALNGKTPEEVKMSLISLGEDQNDKSTPGSIFESRINPKGGIFGYFSSSAETSYLKVYITSPEKHLAIVDQNLLVLTQEGKLYKVDIQKQGKVYENSSDLIVHDLIKPEGEGE